MKPLLLSASLVVFAVPCLAVDDPVLARVGGEAVTVSQVQNEFAARHVGHLRFLGGPSEIRAFLDKVIDRRLLIQEAYRLELDRTPVVEAEMSAFAERRAMETLLEEEIGGSSKPDAAAVEAAWRERTTTIYEPLQIVVATRAEADEIAAELAGGADFAELARARSIARSATRGGALGALGWGVMDEEWERVVFALEPGATSSPFAGEEGWEIVRLVSKRTAEPPPFAEAKERIASILERRADAQRRSEFAAELAATWKVVATPEAALPPGRLAELAASAPATVLFRWEGGQLDLGTFASGLDLAAIDTRPEPVARRELDTLLRRTLNQPLVRAEAARRGVRDRPDLAVEIRARREALMESVLYAEHVLVGVELAEPEARAWYDEHPDAFVAPERRQLAQIVVASEAEAEAARVRIAAGEPFAKVAAEVSIDPAGAAVGGEAGWIDVDRLAPATQMLASLAIGGVSPPVESESGWFLFTVLAIEPGGRQPFEAVEARIREALLEKRKSERRAEWVAKLRAATEIEIDSAAIAELAKSDERSTPSAAGPGGHTGGIARP